MKKFLLFAAAAATLLFTSCNKQDQPKSEAASERAVIHLTVGSPSTKATIADTAEEAQVNSIQVFVFNGDAVDSYYNVPAADIAAALGTGVTITASVGTRDIYAFVNAPSLSSYSSKTALLAAVSTLAENNATNFVMMGKKLAQAIAAEATVALNVDRYAARIRIAKVTRNFTDGLADANFQITKMYLTSAVSNVNYGGGVPAAGYTWLNQSFGTGARSLATTNAFVYNKSTFTPAIAVANNASWTPANPVPFYCYPNEHASNSAGAVGSDQTYRNTRLVVECQIDVDKDGSFEADEFFAYPIYMGAIEMNKSYEINELVLTMLGNPSDGDDEPDDKEDDDISKVNATFTVTVNDWTEVLVGTAGVFTI